MSGTEALIATLSSGLRPVRRLPRPIWRAAVWLLAVAGLGVLLMPMANMPKVAARLDALPDLWWATAGSILTAMAASVAAFQMSVPGRSAVWAALPVLPGLVWLSASGLGCLRSWGLPWLAPATIHDAMGCATLIVLFSLPLSALLVVMLRRACLLWPGRVAAMGGLAAAAAAASLLTLFHPHDASAVDMVVHLLAVLLVVGVTRRVGVRGCWGGGVPKRTPPTEVD